MKLIKAESIAPIIAELAGSQFTTQEFIEIFSRKYPALYDEIISEYGIGGKGFGHPYSANSYFGQSLNRIEGVSLIGGIKAPEEWGHPRISLWECKEEEAVDTIRIRNSIESDIAEILENTELSETQKLQSVLTRIGQEQFRKELIEYWGKCSVTGCNEIKVLIASHIKPWSLSSDTERLDKYNGLLLTPNLDKLFDKGLISFTDNGKILVSSFVKENTLDLLGINNEMKVCLENQHMQYMAFHREHIFETAENNWASLDSSIRNTVR